MKLVFALAFSFSLLYSCSQHNVPRSNIPAAGLISLHEGEWYSNFKNEVFIRCLHKVYSEYLGRPIDSADGSHAANVDQLDFDVSTLNAVDSLADAFSKRQEVSWSIENKRVAMNTCLAYRNSAELDSVAIIFFNKYHKDKD